MTARLLIVISGLAGSGKTTVGRALSEELAIPLIDKDDILEALFDSLGCDDREQRRRLSRASDEALLRLASSAPEAVVVNWWDHDTAPARLAAIADSLLEVFCDCPAEVATVRFAVRRRHPGHLDHLRTAADQAEALRWMKEDYRGALTASPIVVDTSRSVDVDALAALVNRRRR